MEQQIRNDKREKEIRTHAHLMTLIIYSAFTGILIPVSILLSWEMWTVFIMLVGFVGVWILHIGEIGGERMRSYIYMMCIFFEMFFYSIHETSFFDMTIVICIVLFVLTVLNEMPMMYIGLATYVAILLYHTFVTKIIVNLSGVLNFARFGAQLTAIASAFVLARYMIVRRREEKENYVDVIQQLQDMNQQTEDFLANVSHELRTPINAVTGISDVMLQGNLDDETKNNVLDIQDAGRRLFSQINDILDYSEIVSKNLRVEENPYEIASTVNDIICSTAVANRKKGLEIIFDIDPQIPSILYGDEQKLHRIVGSLLENSINFTNQGGIMVRMYSREESYGVNLHISIEDTGIGMTDSQTKQVYDHFYQADRGRTRRVGGMGLGLSIVHGIVKAMGGFMNIESKPEEGTKVSFCIPQKVQHQTPFVSLEDMEEKRVLCFLRKDKYETARVREFYDEMINSMGVNLKVNFVRVFHQREVESYIKKHKVTHVFVSNVEYDECPSYYDQLSKTMLVTIIVDAKWNKKVPPQFIIIRKPFSVISIANVLAQKETGDTIPVMLMGTVRAKDIKVLVVDDDTMNLNVASGILKSYGMEIDVALGGIEALTKCEEAEYDLIFMDHMMPDLDGIETLRRLRRMPQEYNQKVPVIALTANAMSGAREMFMSEGFQGFVPKPIQRNVLERAIRHVLPKDCWARVEESETALEKKENEIEAVKTEEQKNSASELAESPFQYLEQAGINTSSGIAYCAGSEDFYMEMLEEFRGNASKKIEELAQAYNEKDWKAYTIAVHTVKGNSRTIGADLLSDAALELQQAGEEENVDFILANHEDMMRELRRVVRNVTEALTVMGGKEIGNE